jgi:hypothetical protein
VRFVVLVRSDPVRGMVGPSSDPRTCEPHVLTCTNPSRGSRSRGACAPPQRKAAQSVSSIRSGPGTAERAPWVGPSLEIARALLLRAGAAREESHARPKGGMRPLDLENPTWIAFETGRFRCASEGRCLVGGAAPSARDTGPGRCTIRGMRMAIRGEVDDPTQADILQTMRLSQTQVHYSIHCTRSRALEVNKF